MMMQLDQIIADAIAGSPETHVAILAREVVRLREERAVVAPESDEVESLRDTVRFLASVVSKGAQIRHQIINGGELLQLSAPRFFHRGNGFGVGHQRLEWQRLFLRYTGHHHAESIANR